MQDKKKIRVLIVVNRLALGGPIIHVCLLAKLLANECEVIIAGGKPLKNESYPENLFREKEIKPYMIQSMRRGINPFLDLISFIQIYKLIGRIKPQIVHTHASKAGIAGRLAAKLRGVKGIVHTFHGNVFKGYFSPFMSKIVIYAERLMAPLSSSIIAISKSQKNELIKYGIAGESKIINIPLGIETLDTEKLSAENHNNNSTNNTVIGFAGRLEKIKNPELFVDSITLLKQKTDKPFRVIVTGGGSRKEEMIAKFRKAGFKTANMLNKDTDESVFFLSWQYPMREFYNKIDIFALTSLNEGTPLTIMEAMSHGLAVVSTPAGGVVDILESGKDGIITEDFSAEGFSDALKDLIEKPSKRVKLGHSARMRAYKDFCPQKMKEEILKVYKQLSA